jgi:cobalt/nickel transport system permease protein
MHIADGILSNPVMITTNAVAFIGVAYGVRRMDTEDVPKTALLSAAFLTAGLIHFPTPTGSVHLILPGMMGLMLGWSIFPATFCALLLQTLLFAHGGKTAIGANILMASLPGLICHFTMSPFLKPNARRRAMLVGGIAGAVGVLLATMLYGSVLVLSSFANLTAVLISMGVHLPVIVVEAVVTASVFGFLMRTRPDVLHPDAELTPEVS